jgi:DNA polymerase III epsilon subunit-like protein
MTTSSLFMGIDVETARRNRGICEFAAIGIDPAGQTRFRFTSLVDPGHGPWDPRCIAKHGITPDDIRSSPPFGTIWTRFLAELDALAEGYRLVAHNASFERSAISADLGTQELSIELGCTLRLARQRRPDLDSHSLDAVCRALGISLSRHHRAEPDAFASAHIAWILDLQSTVEIASPLVGRDGRWIANDTRGRNRDIIATAHRRGDRLQGQVVVFTGGFANGLERRHAKELAVAHGAVPADSVTGKTTILVIAGVGHPIPPETTLSKKAKDAIDRGIRLMSEPELLECVGWTGPDRR